MRKGMQTVAGISGVVSYAGQTCVEHAPFSVSGSIVHIVAAIVVSVVGMTKKETGAYAPVSLCAHLLPALLLTSLTLTGLARLRGLQRLVGLTTGLATNTAWGEKTG